MKNIALNNFGYEGKVKLSFVHDGKTIRTDERFNSGTNMLFRFFAYSLMGIFDQAALYRPTKIRLLHVDYDEQTGEESGVVPVTGYIYLLTTPERVYNPEIEGETVKLSFMVPKTLITELEDGSSFNRIALYPQCAGTSDTSDIEDYSAYCDFETADGTNGTSNITSWTVSSVLLIDWELTISNKIAKVQDNFNGGNQ